MNPVELIKKKRDGKALADSEIQFFFTQYLKGTIPDYQVSAMLMAIFFQSLSTAEMNVLCSVMIQSGKIADLSSINAPKIDKHSTGGVGDKTSLILAPIVASLGVAVPMISGRGLGHTGGTLDKLESIPNFNVHLSQKKFIGLLKKHHCAFIGQTAELAPIDKFLYALRDVTATVESIPLIASSIMSKKIASGLDGLVLDIKTGVGAFMQDYQRSRALAKTLIEIAQNYDKRVTAFITTMDEPLGYAVGNWLEVKECIECLEGRNDDLVEDTLEISLTLSAAMLVLATKAKSIEEGVELSRRQIQNGEALRKFLQVAKAQGADIEPLIDVSKYPKSKFNAEICADKNGFITEINALEIGLAAVMLGAGRLKKEDAVEPKAGIIFAKKVGDKTRKGERIATIFTNKKSVVESAKARIQKAIRVGSSEVFKKSKILEKL